VRPDKRKLYAGTRSENAIMAFKIDPQSGKLSPAGQVTTAGSPTYITCDRTMRVLFSAFYHDNTIAAFPLDVQGVPQAANQIETDLPHAHCAVMDATNRWLLVATLGCDAIRCYRMDEDGSLVPNNPPMLAVRQGSGPRHLVFSPDNRRVYCINELDGSIDLLDFDSTTGKLTLRESVSLLPHGVTDKPWAAELRLSPDGRFLYASERRSSMLAVFAVSEYSGQLLLRGHYPTETQPRAMAIDSSEKWLLTAGQLSNHLTVYELNSETGYPTALHRQPTGLNPIGIEIVTLP
jgi:6-phosphogluconolactonase